MRIVSLAPFITEILGAVGAGGEVVGIDHYSELPEGAVDVKVVAVPSAHSSSTSTDPGDDRLALGLCKGRVDLAVLRSVTPDLILGAVRRVEPDFIRFAEEEIERYLCRSVRIRLFMPTTLQENYTTCEEIGKLAGRAREGHELCNRIKAQILDWSDNFYARTRNKKISVIKSLQPLALAGGWIPDLVRGASGHPQHFAAGEEDLLTSWDEVARFRPDVIIIALEGVPLQEALRSLAKLERIPEWDQIPAVKRGEVVFADGVSVYTAGPKVITSASVIISGLAGLESGYITKRDEFYRLRFLELHRHRFM